MSSRIAAGLRLLPAAAVVALATHALVYRSFWPHDGVHGYFGWYEPAVGAASLASLVGLALALATAALCRRAGRPIRAGAFAPMPVAARPRTTAASSLVFLLVQESVERSVAAREPAAAQFTPGQWLVLLAGVVLASLLLAVLLRLCESVVRRVLGGRRPSAAQPPAALAWSVVTPVSRRRANPLAVRFGLRAPPPLLS